MPLNRPPLPDTLKKNPWSNLLLLLFLLAAGMLLFNLFGEHKEIKTLSYNSFKAKIEQGTIKEITIDKDQVTAVGRRVPGKKPHYFRTVLPPFQDKAFFDLLEKHQVEIRVKSQKESVFWIAIVSMLPWLLFLGLIFFFA